MILKFFNRLSSPFPPNTSPVLPPQDVDEFEQSSISIADPATQTVLDTNSASLADGVSTVDPYLAAVPKSESAAVPYPALDSILTVDAVLAADSVNTVDKASEMYPASEADTVLTADPVFPIAMTDQALENQTFQAVSCSTVDSVLAVDPVLLEDPVSTEVDPSSAAHPAESISTVDPISVADPVFTADLASAAYSISTTDLVFTADPVSVVYKASVADSEASTIDLDMAKVPVLKADPASARPSPVSKADLGLKDHSVIEAAPALTELVSNPAPIKAESESETESESDTPVVKTFRLDLDFVERARNSSYSKTSSKFARPSSRYAGRNIQTYAKGAFYLPHKAGFTRIVVDVEPGVAAEIKSLCFNSNPVVELVGGEKLIATTEIDLAISGLKSVPKGIENLPVIERVYMGWGHEISPFILRRMLDLEDEHMERQNKISNLPTKFINIKTLKVLGLGQLDPFPKGVDKMQQIEEVDLTGSKMKEMPPSLDKLNSLKVLRLSKNELDSIPRSIEKLPAIETICLWGNNLSEVPPWLFEINTLKEVRLNENKGD